MHLRVLMELLEKIIGVIGNKISKVKDDKLGPIELRKDYHNAHFYKGKHGEHRQISLMSILRK